MLCLPSWSRVASLVGLFIAAAVIVTGCSAKHYRRAADKQVYSILQDYEKQIFGETNAFTIQTPYSGRTPASIPPAEIIESRSLTNRRVINLEEALNLAVEHSREYQAQKEQLYLTALSLTGARYEFGPQFFAGSVGQISGTPSGSEIGSVRSQIGVDQLLKTGGRLSLALGNDLVRYFTGKPNFVSRDSAINTLSVDLTQPLLRGFGINDPTVESLTQAERNVVYAIRSFSLYQKQFAVDIVDGYFGLLTRKMTVRNNYRSYTNRVETTRYTEARAVDRESQASVDDLRTSELFSKTTYINSLAAYLSQLDAFKIRLGVPVSEQLFLDDSDMRELIESGLTPVDIDRQSAFALALQKQMDILNAIDRFEDSKRKVRIAADQLRAELSLFANATLASDQPYDYLNFDPENVRYTAGVRLNLPVDRLRERNNYRATLISFESQIRALSLTLDNYRNQIDGGLRNLEQARLNYLNGVESLKVTQRRYENTRLLYEFGRRNSLDMRNAQEDLVVAENNLANLYAQYLSARLGLMVDIGIIDTGQPKFWMLDPLKDLPAELKGSPPLRMPDDQVLPPERFIEPTT